jgi:hypothetical protein
MSGSGSPASLYCPKRTIRAQTMPPILGAEMVESNRMLERILKLAQMLDLLQKKGGSFRFLLYQ